MTGITDGVAPALPLLVEERKIAWHGPPQGWPAIYFSRSPDNTPGHNTIEKRTKLSTRQQGNILEPLALIKENG
jgi:hypothetical protein